jgi:hypothetical protein
MGRAPYETFIDGLSLYQQYVFEKPLEAKEVMERDRKRS